MKALHKEELVSEVFDELYPLCRSILGEGYRKSLEILKEYIPLEDITFKSGTKVLNWIVPQEWVIRSAWIKDENGNSIIDMKDSNLHVLNYSEPVDKIVDLDELKQHIHMSDICEEAIVYAISYYQKRWGFCMSKKQFANIPGGVSCLHR